jgi:hypothetical protein
MNVDCKWVERNLEALFCDRLGTEDNRVAREHIETCEVCRNELRALKAIDPLIKTYFQRQLETARRPRVMDIRKVFGVSAVAVTLAAILLFAVLRPGQMNSTGQPAASAAEIAPAESIQPPAPIKDNSGVQIERAKPLPDPGLPADRKSVAAPPLATDSPEFLVTDPAGYSHTLADYRNHILVIGVWAPDQLESAANLDRLYRTFGGNPKFRFLGVSNQQVGKPPNTTFPAVYNQGSKLFGAQPGDYLLMDEHGAVRQRGSLVKDFENLRQALQGK